jgi:hypothetical protein
MSDGIFFVHSSEIKASCMHGSSKYINCAISQKPFAWVKLFLKGKSNSLGSFWKGKRCRFSLFQQAISTAPVKTGV